MDIRYYPRFERVYEKLPVRVKKKAEAQELLFRGNPFDARLNTHKLHGKLKNFWSFSISRKYRILFEFIGTEVIFLDVGDHALYQ